MKYNMVFHCVVFCRPKTQPKRNQYTFTPAEKHRLKMAQQSIFNPQNDQNRQTMNENFGIQLPLISDHKQSKVIAFLSYKSRVMFTNKDEHS